MHIKRQYHNCVLPKCSGGKSSPCNNLPKSVWMCCLENDIWLIACHLPGVLNVEADQGFRQFYGRTEWQLHLGIFSKSTDILGTPKIDMFVCRLDKQLPQYVSWKPDPGACHVGAFSFSSNGKFLYIFPPCSLLSRCLQKVGNDQTLALLVVRPKFKLCKLATFISVKCNFLTCTLDHLSGTLLFLHFRFG